MSDTHDVWEREILDADDRDEARDIFYRWLTMLQETRDAVTTIDYQNDVGTILVRTDVDGHHARDLLAKYNRPGRTPLRVIDVNGVDVGVIEISILLAEREPNYVR